MDDWVIWLIIAAALAIVEVMTLTFVLGMLAVGAAAAALSSALGLGGAGQIVVFGVASALLLSTLFPIVRRHRRMPAKIRTGTAKLIGTRAMTVSDITTATGGLVRIGGENWTARPYDVDLMIPAGDWVDVIAIDGVTAVVSPTTLPVLGT